MWHINGRALLVLGLLLSSFPVANSADADKYPVVWGDYWEVTGIKLKDGGALAYARFLADEWRKDQEFAKSKGWIKGYKMLFSPYPRHDEPHLYLVIISEALPSGPEFEKRDDEYMAWKQRSSEQLEKETGDRVEFREIFSGALLQELTFRQ
jgi:hypothetical protein